MSLLPTLRSLLGCTCIALLAFAATAHAQQYNPLNGPVQSEEAAQAPGRVARLAYLSGQVQFAPAGEDDWGSVEINRPMVIGDRLLTGDDGRAVLELDGASVRIDHGSAFDFLNLDQGNIQIELSQGTLNLAVRDMDDGENIEVDTPTIAFVATGPGVYRIDDSPTGTGTMVTVFRGSGVVYGENGASREVTEGTSYRFNDSALASVEATGVPEPDDFDRFCETRDADYTRYAEQQRQYVPPGMIGGDDLYRYGQWDAVPEYGNVWYPRSVPVGWAPYRYGHWAWIDPWGWTWVDDQPWGFAPFHYGRWVYVRNRWGWVPGPVNVRPVYAPALVAFVGGSGVSLSIRVGSGGPVGWFPLGPRDVYVPWFQASRGYFTNVNITNIRNVYINRRVIDRCYDDYRHHRYADIHRRNDYRYRQLPGAVTMVPRTIFADARPVHPAALKLDRKQLRNVRVAVRPEVNPRKASLALRRPAARPAVFHGREPFAHQVVARHAPPPRPADFATREKVIARQHGQPLTATQMRDLRVNRPGSETRNARVKLVAAQTRKPTDAAAPRPVKVTPASRAKAPKAPARTVSVSPSGSKPRSVATRNEPIRRTPLRAGELPSARFRHAERTATLPRPAQIRPAGKPQQVPAGRLPVVQPVKTAPRPLADRTVQPRRPAGTVARPHERTTERSQLQRPQLVQQRAGAHPIRQPSAIAAQQRARQPQVERQRVAQAQMRQQHEAQMRSQQVRAQQAQQQRQAQMRSQQVRVQQAQQQRQVQIMRARQAQAMQRPAPAPVVQRPPERHAPQHAARKPPPAKQRQEQRSRKHPGSSGHVQ